MSLRRYAKSRDSNEKEIVSALRSLPGVQVDLLDRPVDLLCGYNHFNFLLECKVSGRENRSDQQKQKEWRANWPGQVRVVTSVDEAVDCVLNSYKYSRWIRND